MGALGGVGRFVCLGGSVVGPVSDTARLVESCTQQGVLGHAVVRASCRFWRPAACKVQNAGPLGRRLGRCPRWATRPGGWVSQAGHSHRRPGRPQGCSRGQRCACAPARKPQNLLAPERTLLHTNSTRPRRSAHRTSHTAPANRQTARQPRRPRPQPRNLSAVKPARQVPAKRGRTQPSAAEP